jgi:beta-lactamase class D
VPHVVRVVVLTLLAVVLSACMPTRVVQPEADAAFAAAASRAFQSPAHACLVLLDPRSGQTRVMNPTRAGLGFPPASSFKIPNALIGVETGAIPDADHVIAWDGTRHEREVSNQDHSLRAAMAYSVLWYFQTLAQRVGEDRMQAFLSAFDYGNADISSGLTRFWLRGSLRISAREQAAFLRKLHTGTLPVTPRTTAIAKDILTLAEGPGWTYYGKTGTYSGPVDGVESDLGWFVGWIERDGQAVIFAANDSTPGSTGPLVRAKVEQALVDLGELPLDWEPNLLPTPPKSHAAAVIR